jgi:UDP-N-acetylglucosamine acyltransferase
MAIHPTAIVDPKAEIDPSCEIGPYAVIGPMVKMGPGNAVGAHAVIDGDTTFGQGNRVFPFASIGQIPQDLKFHGEHTRVVIGSRNRFREFCTVHLGTEGGGGVTRIGDGCLIMANSHVAHDVQLGDECILGYSSGLGGHVIIEDHVIFSGLAAVHQFVRLGRFAFVSGGAMVGMDVAPYCTVQGDRAQLAGLNTTGLERAGYTPDQIGRVKEAYRITFRSGLKLQEAVEKLKAELGGHPEVDHFVSFISRSERGLTR